MLWTNIEGYRINIIMDGPRLLYRHTRNPMYVGLTAAVLGEALLFGSRAVLWEAAVMALGFHLFVLAYEEPVLGSLFGAQYQTYRAHVPRWLPRLVPWTPKPP